MRVIFSRKSPLDPILGLKAMFFGGGGGGGGQWYRNLFGFTESTLEGTRREFTIEEAPGDTLLLRSKKNNKAYNVGNFSTPSLGELQARAGSLARGRGLIRVTTAVNDVSVYHGLPENKHATFQVASQFNCLEFPSPRVTPEEGVTGYIGDRTQGPACSIACGPATVFRNNFVNMDDASTHLGSGGGQSRNRQINNLLDVSTALGNEPEGRFFEVRNGYVFANGTGGLTALNEVLQQAAATAGEGGATTVAAVSEEDRLLSLLRVGVHRDVQVTSSRWGAVAQEDEGHTVTQVFGSALSVAYDSFPTALWEPMARLVLRASYRATFYAAAEAAARHSKGAGRGENKLFLTLLGGGVFGNDMAWIVDAIREALVEFQDSGLEVIIVSYGGVHPMVTSLCEEFASTSTPAPNSDATASASAT